MRRPGNGLTYTESQAVGVGRTAVTTTRRDADGLTTLRMPVEVVCRSGDISLGHFTDPTGGRG